VVVAAKTISDASKTKPFPPNPNSQQSTISTVVREIREAGHEASEVQVDVRDFESVQQMVNFTVQTYGRLDVLVYNSGAIWWSSVENTPMKRFQLMQKVNPEGLYGTVQAALPHFKNQGWKGRIIVVSPPIYSRFFRGKTSYAMGKIGMSVLTKGIAMDWVREGKNEMAITSIWPAAAIESAATQNPQTDKSELRHPVSYLDLFVKISL
jgi:NAD(P)-dependent dehydrogenase (short-subunit alcohol dehydrogenase family)